MGFAEDIAKFVQKANGNADAVIRKIVMDVGRSLVEKTPVGNPSMWESLNPYTSLTTKTGKTRVRPKLMFGRKPPPGYTGGHARANWQHSIGSPVVSEVVGVDKGGGKAINAISASIPEKAAGLVHFVTNSVPYIQALEDGHSKQAPNGMVGLTEVEFGGIVQRSLQVIK